MPVFFNGATISIPGAYSKIDASGMVTVSAGGQRILAIIGEAEGGIPQTPIYFNNPIAARNTFIAGDLLEGMKVSWNPSNELPGADIIVGMRVNAATQASHVLLGSDVAESLKLTSRVYGSIYNYEVKVIDNTGKRTLCVKETTTGAEESTPECTTLDELVGYVNNKFNLVTATKLGAELPSIEASYTPFETAGTNPAPVSTDWETCIEKLVSLVQVDGIVPFTESETIQTLFKNHVLSMSALKIRKERRIFVGHPIGETVEQIKTRAFNLGTTRAVLCTPGIKLSIGGEVVTKSSLYTACAVAGLWAGGDPAEPLTFKYLNCLGLEKEYNDLELESLLNSGVLPLQTAIGKGYRIVQAITTYLTDANLVYRELSMATVADLMSRNIRSTLEDMYVGKKGLADLPASVKNTVTSLLSQFEKLGWIAGSESVPAFRNIVVFKEATVVNVEYEASIAEPNNFILITSHFRSANVA